MAVVPVVVSYSLKTAVSGEAIRMRSQFMPLLLIFAGIGYAIRERQRAAEAQRAARLRAGAEFLPVPEDEAAS